MTAVTFTVQLIVVYCIISIMLDMRDVARDIAKMLKHIQRGEKDDC